MLTFDISETPHVRLFGRIKYAAGWESAPRRAKHHALFYVRTGALHFTIEGQLHALTEGDAFLIPQGTAYFARCPEDADFYYLHFLLPLTQGQNIPHNGARKTTYLPERANTLCLAQKTALGPRNDKMRELTAACARYVNCRQTNDKLHLDITLLRILVLLSDLQDRQTEQNTPRSGGYRLCRSICQYVEEHYSEHLSLPEIAKSVGVSVQYASRVFREHMHKSITEHVTAVRMEKAEELLKYTARSVKEIAFATGFSNPFYFHRVFAKTHGITPSHFRAVSAVDAI